MARQKTITLYQFEELSDAAKEKARDWFRETVFTESHDWEFVYDDAVTIAALFGVEISTSVEKYHVMGRDGKPGRDYSHTRTNIFFSGFWSQGDGASFEGQYQFKADGLAAVKDHAGQDEKLHAIVAEIQTTQEALKKAHGFTLSAKITTSGNYSHSNTMGFEFDYASATDDGEYVSIDALGEAAAKAAEDAEKILTSRLRAYADWIYRNLEREHDWQSSNEAIDESMAANEYEFNEDGSIA